MEKRDAMCPKCRASAVVTEEPMTRSHQSDHPTRWHTLDVIARTCAASGRWSSLTGWDDYERGSVRLCHHSRHGYEDRLGAFFFCVALAFGGYYVGRATAPDSEPAKAAPKVETDAGDTAVSPCVTEKPVRKPKEIVGTCADGGVMAKDIRWTYWTTDVAVGTATVSANNCEPSCADGQFIARPANVILDQRQANGSGPQFTRMVVAYQDHRPGEEFDATNVREFSLPMHPSS